MKLKKALPIVGYLWTAFGGILLTPQAMIGTICLTIGLLLILYYTKINEE